MITYPHLKKGATIGVTAPSSGVPLALHGVLNLACRRMEERGYKVVTGETAWTQEKAKSAPARKRAAEFNEMMASDEIDIIIPPWGGELLIEMVEHVDYETMENNGY